MGITEVKRPQKSNPQYFTVSQPLSLHAYQPSCLWDSVLGSALGAQEQPSVGNPRGLSAATPAHVLCCAPHSRRSLGLLLSFTPFSKAVFFTNSMNNLLKKKKKSVTGQNYIPSYVKTTKQKTYPQKLQITCTYIKEEAIASVSWLYLVSFLTVVKTPSLSNSCVYKM